MENLDGIVDGRNPANQLIGSLPRYLHGLYIRGGAGYLPDFLIFIRMYLHKDDPFLTCGRFVFQFNMRGNQHLSYLMYI